MSQLSFDGFVAGAPVEETPTPKPSSWYKGRTLSHSSIQLYRTCPQKWKFRYIDKVPEKPKSFFSFGKSVHNSLEYLFTTAIKQPDLTEVLVHYKTTWLSEGYESPAQEKWFYLEGERILKGFYAKHHADFAKILKVEFRFTFDVEGVPVTGFIDRIDNTPSGGLALLDYKTGKAFDKSRVRTDPQLTLYQMAAKQLLGKPVESVTLYHLNSLTPLTVATHSAQLESEVTTNVVSAARGITDQNYEPKVDEKGHCQWCDYQQICPAFSGRKAVGLSALPSPEVIAQQVDRYAKLEAKLSELNNEKTELRQTLTTYMKGLGTTELEGRHFAVTSKEKEPGAGFELETKERNTKTDA